MMAVLMPIVTTLALVLTYFVHSGRSELFTSIEDMKRVLYAENQVATDLRQYVAEEQLRLQQILTIADDYEEHSKQALENSEAYLSNPINAFLLVRRFTSQWQESVVSLVTRNTAEVFMGNVSQALRDFPSDVDLKGAAFALLRLQDTYGLTPEGVSRGELTGVNETPLLSAADCMELGKQAYFHEDYYHALPWFQQALVVLEEETVKTFDKAKLLDFFAYGTFMQGNIHQAMGLTRQWLELDPTSQRAQTNLRYYSQNLGLAGDKPPEPVRNEPKFDQWRSSDEFKVYQSLCRGEETRHYSNAGLKCYHRRHHVLFYLAPLKEEIIYLKPKIFIFHDVLSTSDVDKIKEVSFPLLHRSGVFSLGGDDPNSDIDYRVSKSAWLEDRIDPQIARMATRISAMSNLTLDTAEGFQVLNYGIGGHYEPHFDFVRDFEDNEFSDQQGNRIATCICYVSDVEAGGATIFVRLGVKVWPKKGACALWFNLKRNGQGDYDTFHAGCPVLSGSKWISNKWFHERGQEFTRPCSTDPDE